MDEQLEIGPPNGLHCRLRWLEARSTTAADITRGDLQVWIDETLVWGAQEAGIDVGIEWSWIELLEHLSLAWPYLEWEEGNPLNLNVFPDELRAEAEKRWRAMPSARRDAEEHLLYEYSETHNLAAAPKGLYLPALWIAREGNRMRLVGAGRRVARPLEETLRSLEALGQAIFERVKPLKNADERTQAALKSWSNRRKVAIERFIAIATGLPKASVDDLMRQRSGGEWLGVSSTKPQPNELLAAARMIGTAAPVSTMRAVIEKMQRITRGETVKLDRFSRDFTKELAKLSGDTSADQGTALAKKLRSDLNLGTKKPADPIAILKSWGVQVVSFDLRIASIDAIACWGPRHGPAVLVNSSGLRAQGIAGRRATLAHELCHLLVDRFDALPLGEVLGGNLPPLVEPRANAFAAELLFPREVAIQLARVPHGILKNTVTSMVRRYRVSREVIAWQVRNSDAPLSERHAAYFRGLVSEPRRF